MSPSAKRQIAEESRQFTMWLCFCLTLLLPPCAGIAYDAENFGIFTGFMFSAAVAAGLGLLAYLQGPPKDEPQKTA